MGLLEEAEAAGDFKWDASAGEFHLQFHGVKMGAVEHSHFFERHSFFVELEDALGDEFGLLAAVGEGDEGGALVGRRAGGAEVFGVLLFVVGDGGVGDGEDFGATAIVGFDLVDLGVGVALGEVEDVAEVCAAPRVDGLGVVADDHDVVVAGGEEFDEVVLEVVGVLIFIDEDVLKLPLILLGDARVLFEKADGFFQQVVEVQGVGLFLFLLVASAGEGELRFILEEVRVFFHEHIGEGAAGVELVAEHVGENLAGRGAFFVGFEVEFGDDVVHEIDGIFAVEDGKAGGETRIDRVAAEDAVADAVKGAAPQPVRRFGDEAGDAVEHFARSFIRESEEQNVAGDDAVFDEVGDAIRERARLPRARASDDERWAGRRGDGGELLGI